MNTVAMKKEQIKYAGFWRRLAAYLVDYFIIGIICWIISLIGVFGNLLRFLILAVYLIGFWSTTGQTPGKAVVGIKIVRLDGANIGLGNAVLRFIGYIVSSIIFFIGFLMIGWHGKKRGLHDLIAATVVINVPSIISEIYSRAELESALAEADEIQRGYHGV
jgi:uncharacterized RDD family membrane protein YckC